jgi:hypothetical protein
VLKKAGGCCEGINEFCGCGGDGIIKIFVEGSCILGAYVILDLLVSARFKKRLGEIFSVALPKKLIINVPLVIIHDFFLVHS